MGAKKQVKALLRKAQDRFIFHNRALFYVLKYLLFKRDNLEDNSYILGINEAGLGFGDSMVICGLAEEYCKKNRINLYIYVAKKQMILARLYEGAPCVNLREYRAATGKGRLVGYYFYMQGIFANRDGIGYQLREFLNTRPLSINFVGSFIDALGLDRRLLAKSPTNPFIALDEGLRAKVEALPGCSLEKIVMINPISISGKYLEVNIKRESFEELANALNEKGFKVLSNVMKKEEALKGTLWLELSAKDAYALALQCHAVIAMRSGFCNLLHQCPCLLVIEPSQEYFDRYNLASIFTEARAKELVFDEASFIADAMKFVDGLNKNEAS